MRKQRQQPSGKRPVLLASALLMLCGGFFVPRIFALVTDWHTPHPANAERTVRPENTGKMIRGNIYDRRGTPIAVSLPLASIYVKPVELSINREQLAFLEAVLKLGSGSLEKQLKSERSVVWLARYISPQIAEEIRQQKIPGLYLISEPQRYYPEGETGSHVVGCFKDGHGLSGIEFSLDQVLQSSEQGAAQADRVLSPFEPREAEESKHVILQLDLGLQKIVEKKLAQLQKRASAAAAWAVVMQPDNGAVLAIASRPTYNPNRFWEFSEEALVNRAEQSNLAIGSWAGLFKLAELLDKGDSLGEIGGSIDGNKKSDEWRKGIAGDFVSDSLWRLLAHVPAAPVREDNKFFSIRKRSTFETGALARDDGKDEGPRDKISTLQLLSGFSALVNGGRLPTPQMIKAVCDREGASSEKIKTKQTVVLKPETSGILRALLTADQSGFVLLSSLREKEIERQEDSADNEKLSPAAKEAGPGSDGLFDAVMLGYSSGRKGDTVLAVVLLDGSNAADFGGKGFALAGEEILRKSAKTVAVDIQPLDVPALQVDLGAAYDSWQAIQEKIAKKEDSKGKVPARKESMPQVIGLSLRKALHILQPLGLSFSIEGSGVVVVQKPKAGELLKNRTVTLRLKQDAGSIRSM